MVRETDEDRLHVLDVNVSVEAAPTRVPSDTYQYIAVCDKTRIVAIANGRFVDLYGICANTSHPFTFLHQISIFEHVLRMLSPSQNCEVDVACVVATCVIFPVPGILLVGTVSKSKNSKSERKVLLLGFRLYAGSVTHLSCGPEDKRSRTLTDSLHVSFSFAEAIVGANGQRIQRLHSFRQDMTPDAGSVLMLFNNSLVFGALSWKARLSDRFLCLAQVKQQATELVTAACSQDGHYVVLGDIAGRLMLIDFRNFLWNESNVEMNLTKCGGKRLNLGPCSRVGVTVQDNPLERVRLLYTLPPSGRDCAYTSLQWWSEGSQGDLKQVVLAGQQDGSLHIFELVQGTDVAGHFVRMHCIQMYPGLASGSHDAVRRISNPIPCPQGNLTRVEFVVISTMRWRIWQVKVAERKAKSSQQCRVKWPSVRESLAFPSFPLAIQDAICIVLLSNSFDFSLQIAKALSDSTPNYTFRKPVSLTITANRLHVVGLLSKAVAESEHPTLMSKCDASNETDIDVSSERDSDRVEPSISKGNDDKECDLSTPITIQDKYKLPRMQWRARTSTLVDPDLTKANCPPVKMIQNVSKVSRVEQIARVNDVIQRVETLNGVLCSMRTSLQLFSADVECHVNFVSKQLEELVTSKTDQLINQIDGESFPS